MNLLRFFLIILQSNKFWLKDNLPPEFISSVLDAYNQSCFIPKGSIYDNRSFIFRVS